MKFELPKLTIKKENLVQLSADIEKLPMDATDQVAGGKPCASDSWCSTEFQTAGGNCFSDGC
ncbi:MAG: hypothetical protein HRT35_38065 [Algicola sp.]|nr:hypothetical protein [Algicola sp.]